MLSTPLKTPKSEKKRKSGLTPKTPKINVCNIVPTNPNYDEKYQYIVNCLQNPANYLNIKKAVSKFLYQRNEHSGKPINRRKTLELCSNTKLANMFIENPGDFNLADDVVCCSICGKRINQGDKYEIDHLMPSTFFFVLFAKYYHSCQHPRITKEEKGTEMCNEYIENNDCGQFVTKLISITHKGCNQGKGDAMFFRLDIKESPNNPETVWKLKPNQPVINDFINRYIEKLYPNNNKYTGMGYMNAERFEEHAVMLTNGISKEEMMQLMTNRLNSFVEYVCYLYKGGTMGHIFANLFLLKAIPLTLINKTNEVEITEYMDEIFLKYESVDLVNLGIIQTNTISTKSQFPRFPRKTTHFSENRYSIKSNIVDPSFEQVCELIDDAIEKQNAEKNSHSGLGFVRKKTKRNIRRPRKANKTRTKRA